MSVVFAGSATGISEGAEATLGGESTSAMEVPERT